jgi:(p)ppGpp synthase/HD superfamily hydrolase
MSKPSTYLTPRFSQAISYAVEMHKDQVRKSTTTTYICHPLGVTSLVLEAGGDEDQAIAALLHDVPEDCGGEPRLLEIGQMFGQLVEDPEEKAPWRERKEVHIEHLENANHDTLIVTAADKAHNARAIATDLQNIGKTLWERFNAGSEDIIWYYESVYSVLEREKISPAILIPLSESIQIMRNFRD